MIVLGINKTGKTMPEITPKRDIALPFDIPLFTNIAGSKTATAEFTKELLARTEVIGRDALNSGFRLFLGAEIFPPRSKNKKVERVKENR